jgi:radical SAM superfamily enzyme
MEWQNKNFSCLTMEEYGEILKQCINILPKDIVVHRITGDGDKKSLIAPLWTADKKRVLNYLNKVLQKTL